MIWSPTGDQFFFFKAGDLLRAALLNSWNSGDPFLFYEGQDVRFLEHDPSPKFDRGQTTGAKIVNGAPADPEILGELLLCQKSLFGHGQMIHNPRLKSKKRIVLTNAFEFQKMSLNVIERKKTLEGGEKNMGEKTFEKGPELGPGVSHGTRVRFEYRELVQETYRKIISDFLAATFQTLDDLKFTKAKRRKFLGKLSENLRARSLG